jgi:hypothetical protein
MDFWQGEDRGSAYAANALLEIKLDDKDGGGTVIGRRSP